MLCSIVKIELQVDIRTFVAVNVSGVFVAQIPFGVIVTRLKLILFVI